MPHRLTQLMREVGEGRFPEQDGAVEVLPPAAGTGTAVVALAAHHVIAAAIDGAWVRARLPDGDLGAPMSPAFLGALAERLGVAPGPTDVVLCAPADRQIPGLDLVRLLDGHDHTRILRAHRYRSDVRAYAAQGGAGRLITGRGLAGRWEAAFEVEPAQRGRGLGRRLAAAARAMVPRGEAIFLQVTPGNVASMRAVLAAGYRPVGAEVLFTRPER
ncbi:MAG TPA: GNAT family N-acetyltransferase [Candidatus Dormibacteraeota bacterium]|jgi:GNAT superfamily N-acetyltransferase|nr:GNAT family N-acetyltransferase [Candidatus Dormibacteraeota bacterium]